MKNIGTVKIIQITEVKHGPKVSLNRAMILKDFGIEGDRRGGRGERQISVLSDKDVELINKIGDKGLCTRKFSSNIVTCDSDLSGVVVGDVLTLGDAKCLLVSIGKHCYEDCDIRQASGPCPVSKMGMFLKVIESGVASVGDSLIVLDGGEQ